MKNKYFEQLSALLKQVRPRLATTHRLEFKNCFGAVAGYVDGQLFISCGNFGIALKLPQKVLIDLFSENKAKPLKYFPNGHIKKEYAVLSQQILENKHQLKKLLDTSIRLLKHH